MTLERWLAFVIATSILTLIPGPCVVLLISQALTRGVAASLMCIFGDIVGGAVLMMLSLLGVGAILAASATLFAIFKWLGVFYMAYLGYCQILEAKNTKAQSADCRTQALNMGSFKAGFIASLLNPKAIIFYMAFLSQFMNADKDPLLQFSILILTSSLVTGLVLVAYALLASSARALFQSERSKQYFSYSGGSFLIGNSVFIASTAKS
ncbi:LysE family translocator [Alginatibacterium sediminis]|uniref:LysE family translocator n=1 Tax=Alginatibacterium sediminis TaxID=2164068 RepID=A0A420EBH9_9ALTE|nr:LysE family translocator [Alginatibacterium sediminis]RKF18049.1 LysE family translocator [Alginatibacterium sediminis]